jgi:uncharacterized alpha-E superfamily protein
MSPTTVAGFILLNPRFPRSLPHCVSNIEATLDGLLENEDLANVSFSREPLDVLKALTRRPPDGVIAAGLHEYLDEVQLALLDFSAEVSSTFFDPS